MSKPKYYFEGYDGPAPQGLETLEADFDRIIEDWKKSIDKALVDLLEKIGYTISATSIKELKDLADIKMDTSSKIKPNKMFLHLKHEQEILAADLKDIEVYYYPELKEDTVYFIYTDSERGPAYIETTVTEPNFKITVDDPNLIIIGKII